jgi:two-component system cell cycle sensor histidine kinase/response regulator CckA
MESSDPYVSAVTSTGKGPVVRSALLPLPAPAKLLYLAVVAAALAAAAAALAQLGTDTPGWPTFALLSVAAGAAHLFIVRTGRNTGFHTGIVFITAAALLLPPELVALIGLAPFVPEWVKERYPWYIGTFNIANFTLGALGAWGTAQLVREWSAGPYEVRFAVAGLAAALTFVFLNHFLLAAMLRLARGHSFRESELFSVKSLAPELVLATLGVALAALWIANPWVLPAVVPPLVWSHRSFGAVALLRESEERFRAMFELAPVGSRLLDLDRRTVDSNRALEHMLGYSAAELVALPPSAYTDPDDEERDRELFAELLEGRRDHYEVDKRYLAKDGRTVLGRLAVSLVRDADGRPKFAIGMIEDTTEQKLAEESLRQSEERYRELFENARDMVFTLDFEGRFTAINRAGEGITGFRRAELLGRSMQELLGDDCFNPITDEDGTSAYECEFVARDGRRVALEVASRPIRVGGEAVGIQGVARDVSERRALEEQLRQAQKMEAVGQLAGGVAHDFNNLLTAISGYSEFALGRLDDSDPKLRSNITEIKRSAARASALTRQLLAFSRKQILQPRLLRPDELVGGLDDLLRRLIGTHIEVLTVSRPGLGLVRADPGQLEQVVVNLVVNARDAMPDGGRLTIETANVDLDEADARAHDTVLGSYVMLAVHDTGSGIEGATLQRIFEPFFTTKEQGKGTGLGLATVYGIVQQSGGFVTVESEVGRGSTFCVHLPRHEAESASTEPEEKPAPGLAEGSETVLLVEDESVVRSLIREILEDTGYNVLEAADGVDALAQADAHTGAIDLLLTDVVMPNMSGRDLAERFRGVRPDTKILYTSGYTDGAIADEGVLAPGTEFIQKPFSFAELTNKVRSVLDAAA